MEEGEEGDASTFLFSDLIEEETEVTKGNKKSSRAFSKAQRREIKRKSFNDNWKQKTKLNKSERKEKEKEKESDNEKEKENTSEIQQPTKRKREKKPPTPSCRPRVVLDASFDTNLTARVECRFIFTPPSFCYFFLFFSFASFFSFFLTPV